MEKSLVEKMQNGTVDEIDRDMIASRCWDVTKKFYKLFNEFEKGLRELIEDHKEEMAISHIAIIAGMRDISDDDVSGFRCAIGSGDDIRKLVGDIMKEVK